MRREPPLLSYTITKTVASLALVACLAALPSLAGPAAFAQQADDAVAVLETDLGTIVIEFFPDDAPNHASNFITLAESGFYDGTLFHRIIPGFMIQGGDPNTIDGNSAMWGMGGPPHTVDAEFNDIEHDRGIVSMARSQDPHSAGSQFFIVHQDSNFLDGQYTVFGRIITESSFETLDAIAGVETGAQDKPVDAEQVRIRSVTVTERSEIPDALELPLPERSSSVMDSPPSPTAEQLFDSAELGISFMAPPGWFVQEPDSLSPDVPDVVAVGPQRDGGIPQIYVFVKDADQMTLDEIIDARVMQLEEILSEEYFATLSQDTFAVAGLPAHMLDLTELVTANNRTIEVRFVEVFVYGGDKYYVLSYANIVMNFEDELPRFERVLETFAVKGMESSSAAATTSEDALQDDPTTDKPPLKSEEIDQTATDQTPDQIKEEDEGETGGDDNGGPPSEVPPSEVFPGETGGDDNGGGGCLIATAAFGSELAPQIQTLREIRDSTVLSTESGVAFMSGFNTVYYSFSPTVADLEREHPILKDTVRILVTPMISSLSLLDAAEAGSDLDILMYGSLIILLNIGLYIAAPIIALVAVAKVVRSTTIPASARRLVARA